MISCKLVWDVCVITQTCLDFVRYHAYMFGNSALSCNIVWMFGAVLLWDDFSIVWGSFTLRQFYYSLGQFYFGAVLLWDSKINLKETKHFVILLHSYLRACTARVSEASGWSERI